MQESNPQYPGEVADIFETAGFVRELGIKLKDVGPGWCETTLQLEDRHTQQDGYAHAGLIATIADHTAGGSSHSLIPAGAIALSIEFKVNFLRPGIGESLRCRAEVLKAGKTVIVSESEVYARRGGEETLIAKATVTLAVVKRNT